MFEDAFGTGFFEYQSNIFGPVFHDIDTRLVAFQAMEMQNPLRNIMEESILECNHQWYLEGFAYISQREVLDD